MVAAKSRRNTRRSKRTKRATKRRNRKQHTRKYKAQRGGAFFTNRLPDYAVADFRSMDDEGTEAPRLMTVGEARAIKEEAERA